MGRHSQRPHRPRARRTNLQRIEPVGKWKHKSSALRFTMTIVISYSDWLKSVDAFLASRRPGVRRTDLDDNALAHAHRIGMSPVDFVSQPNLPWKPAIPPPAPPASAQVPFQPPYQIPKAQPSQGLSANFIIGLIVFVLLFGGGCGLFNFFGPHGFTVRTASDVKSKVRFGMSESEVRSALGSPNSQQEMNINGQSFGGVSVPGSNSRFLYYDVQGGMVQIGLENGRVNSINSY